MKTKKSKRIISLILALTMVFTFMAMSASAATTEVPEVQPRASYCPQCGGLGFQYWYTDFQPEKEYYKYDTCSRNGCTAGPSTHVHYVLPAYIYSKCATCGYYERFWGTDAFCPYRDSL